MLLAGCGAFAQQPNVSPVEQCEMRDTVAQSLWRARMVSGSSIPSELALPVGEGVERHIAPHVVVHPTGVAFLEGQSMARLGDAVSMRALRTAFEELRRTWPEQHPNDAWSNAVHVEAPAGITVRQLAELAASLGDDTHLLLALRHPDPMRVGLSTPAPEELRATLTAIHALQGDAQSLALIELARLVENCRAANIAAIVTLGSAPRQEDADRFLRHLGECECDSDRLYSIAVLALATAQNPHGYLTALDLSFAPESECEELSIARSARISALVERAAESGTPACFRIVLTN